jgi:hypothetical protein
MGRTLKMLTVLALYARVGFTVSRVTGEGRGLPARLAIGPPICCRMPWWRLGM